MMAWANLAAERAALTSDAGFDTGPADGWERFDGLAVTADEPSPGRLARMRQRVDALLAELLADDCYPECDAESASGPADPAVPDTIADTVVDGEVPGAALADGGEAADATPRAVPAAAQVPDEGFWGPGEGARDAQDSAPPAGYKSRHRQAGQENETRTKDSNRRARPRHAAPPATFAAAVGRWFAGFRLLGHYAAHAA
ncbi:MAG TPA: hypothetical protein VF834_02985 [Streptosporangiaceae bacterium]